MHSHTWTDELNVYAIPADPTKGPPYMTKVKNDFRAASELVNGGYIEIVRPYRLPPLECGCRVVMVVNEEGRLLSLPRNEIAGLLYPSIIAGDVFLVGEGPVESEGVPEPDFISLPENSDESTIIPTLVSRLAQEWRLSHGLRG